MKQFFYVPGGVSNGVNNVAPGQVAIATMDTDGKLVAVTGSSSVDKFKQTFYLIIGREKELGGNISVPCSTNHLTITKTQLSEAVSYEGSVTIPEPTVDGHYTIILVKKGLKFNERNRWTATIPVKVGDSAEAIAAKLAKYFEANANNLNITVTIEGAAITINSADNLTMVAADDLMGVEITETPASKGVDKAWIEDLANKCAADAGYLYTYQDLDVNPGYPFNFKQFTEANIEGFELLTLRFAVPRDNKTRDEVVHQVVHLFGNIENIDTVFSQLNAMPLPTMG